MPVAWAASPPPSAGSALAVLLLCNRPRRHANTWPWAWRRRLLSVGVRGRPGVSAGDRQDQADVTQITLGCRSDAAPAAVALPTSPASPTTRPSCPGRTSSVHSADILTPHAGTASHAWPMPWQSMPPTEERPIAITALRCRISPFIGSRRRLRRRGPASAPRALPWEARPGARRATSRAADPLGSPGRAARVLHEAVFLGASLSRSRSPRLGHSLRLRRMRSAAPNPRPGGHSHTSWHLRGRRGK